MRMIKKKIIFIILISLLLISGCSRGKKYIDICKDKAIGFTVNILNNQTGYDSNKEYLLECHLKSEKELYPELFVLKENGEVVLQFVARDDTIGEANFIYGDKEISISRVDETFDISPFKYQAGDFSINDFLYLEKVKDIVITNDYNPTPKEKYELIKEAVTANLFFFEANKDDIISVYENINTIVVAYDKDTNTIASTTEECYTYPVAINNELVGIVWVNADTFEAHGAAMIDAEMRSLIEDGEPFIFARSLPSAVQQGICISSNRDNTIMAPVMLSKCYPKLKEYSSNQPVYEVLFEFTYVNE